jgi:hypothetical protein
VGPVSMRERGYQRLQTVGLVGHGGSRLGRLGHEDFELEASLGWYLTFKRL